MYEIRGRLSQEIEEIRNFFCTCLKKIVIFLRSTDEIYDVFRRSFDEIRNFFHDNPRFFSRLIDEMYAYFCNRLTKFGIFFGNCVIKYFIIFSRPIDAIHDLLRDQKKKFENFCCDNLSKISISFRSTGEITDFILRLTKCMIFSAIIWWNSRHFPATMWR